ncbi:MAG: Isoleucine-tRNA ligase, partial [Candidatus Yanofskybacteria bacterium GW2011_GWD2_39_48]
MKVVSIQDILRSNMYDHSETENRILDFWKKDKTFAKSLTKNKDKKKFVFFDGPPTANGRPGIHHFLGRAFKDLYGRYKTMRGFYVLRRAGWDTHGLPVEIEVEKQLGFKNKKDIEDYGIANFNKRCRESVWKYKKEWENMVTRMGHWIDMDDSYITYSPKYMETLWWIIKQIWDNKYLYKAHRVVPFCTRCGTPLSSHEVAQGYQLVKERSVYLKFKVKHGQVLGRTHQDIPENTYILAWTTTPWTLPGNVALAVGENIEYEMWEQNGEHLILAAERRETVGINGNPEIRGIMLGKDLVGLEYEPLFDIPELKSDESYKVYPADFVSTTDGTGVVHTAVMYGEDDYNLGFKIGLPTIHTVDEQGKFKENVGNGL